MEISINLTFLNGIKLINSKQSITKTFLKKEFPYCFLHVTWDEWVFVDVP